VSEDMRSSWKFESVAMRRTGGRRMDTTLRAFNRG
jgi:hypothetical protein